MWGAEVSKNTYLQWLFPNNKVGPTVGSKPRDTLTVGHSAVASFHAMRRRGAEVDLDKHAPANVIGVSMARAAACRAAQRLARAQKGGVHSWAPCHAASFISDEKRWKRSTTGMRASAHSLKRIPTELDRGSSPLEKATPCTLLSAALAPPND